MEELKEAVAATSSETSARHKHWRSRSAPDDIVRINVQLLPIKDSLLDNEALQLVEDIRILEDEIARLEKYLLTIYRNFFCQHLNTCPCVVDLKDSETSDLQRQNNKKSEISRTLLLPCKSPYQLMTSEVQNLLKNKQHLLEAGQALKWKDTCPVYSPSHKLQYVSKHEVHSADQDNFISEEVKCTVSPFLKQSGAVPHTLKDYLFKSPNKLSEELVQCIAGIYLKLSKSEMRRSGTVHSSSSSLSCTGTSSPCDPGSHGRSPQNAHSFFDNSGRDTSIVKDYMGDLDSHASMVEVPWIGLDEEKLTYATHLLRIFRTMVEHLEHTDPTQMGHRAKLAFWINIYNCLAMHAFLVYGMPRNNSHRLSLLKRVAYKVGKYSINAIAIEQSILGCKMPHGFQWFQRLVSSKELSKSVKSGHTSKHMYCLDRGEPLTYFGLCSGGTSDPVLRVYTEDGVYRELEAAKKEFLEASIGIYNGGKITLPKLLRLYMKEVHMDSRSILSWICQNVSESKCYAIKKFMEIEVGKFSTEHIEWVPYNGTFRYLFNQDLVARLLEVLSR